MLSSIKDRSNGGTDDVAGGPPPSRRRKGPFVIGPAVLGLAVLGLAVGLAGSPRRASAGVVVPGSLQAAEASSRPALPIPLTEGEETPPQAPASRQDEIVVGLDDADVSKKMDGAAILDDAVFSTLQPQGFDPLAPERGDDAPLAVTLVDASGIRRAAWPGASSPPKLGIHRPSDQTGLRGLLAQYVNIIPTRTHAPGGRAENAARALDDSGAAGAPFAASYDPIAERVSATVSDWLGRVLRPTTGVEGLVSFSVVGFGNFAIVASEDSRRIGVMDLNSGRVMTVSTGRVAARSGNTVMIDRRATAEQKRRRTHATRFSDVIGAIVAFLYEFVTSPLKMSFVILALIVWGVWRVSASRA